MANRAFPYTPELKPFQDLDDAWSVELARCGISRWTAAAKGEEGSALRRIYDARMTAQARWHQSSAR
jgi:hypothetical protein